MMKYITLDVTDTLTNGDIHFIAYQFHVIIRLLIPNTVVVHWQVKLLAIYTEILVQYHNKATDTVCPIKLKREELSYTRTIFNFQAESVLIYMLLFY